jgi:hypothetical protein
MNKYIFYFISFIILIISFGCSGQGTDLIDSTIIDNNELSIFSIDTISNGLVNGEIARFNDTRGFISKNDIFKANKTNLVPSIDFIYESYDRLYLHHREEGSISILSLENRKIISKIVGFPQSKDDGICGMAFSNLSQAWVISHNTKKVYLVDVVNHIIAREIDISGYPTCISTLANKVFIGTEYNGVNKIEIISSNNPNYEIERFLLLPSPAIYMGKTITNFELENPLVVLCSGYTNGEKPRLLYMTFLNNGLDIGTNLEIEHPPIDRYVGKEPNFIGISNTNQLYLLGNESILKFDLNSGRNSSFYEILTGFFSLVSVDPTTDLVYAFKPENKMLSRSSKNGDVLDDIKITNDVKTIRFVSSNKVQ